MYTVKNEMMKNVERLSEPEKFSQQIKQLISDDEFYFLYYMTEWI